MPGRLKLMGVFITIRLLIYKNKSFENVHIFFLQKLYVCDFIPTFRCERKYVFNEYFCANDNFTDKIPFKKIIRNMKT